MGSWWAKEKAGRHTGEEEYLVEMRDKEYPVEVRETTV